MEMEEVCDRLGTIVTTRTSTNLEYDIRHARNNRRTIPCQIIEFQDRGKSSCSGGIQRRTCPQDAHLRSKTLPGAPGGSISEPRTKDVASRGPRNLRSRGTLPSFKRPPSLDNPRPGQGIKNRRQIQQKSQDMAPDQSKKPRNLKELTEQWKWRRCVTGWAPSW